MNITDLQDALIEICTHLSLRDFKNFCSTCNVAYDKTYCNNYFWFLRYKKECVENVVFDTNDWKSLYMKYGSILLLGSSEMPTDLELSNIRGITNAVCGSECTFIANKYGEIKANGCNEYSQMGIVNNMLHIKTFENISYPKDFKLPPKNVASGVGHTLIIDDENNVWALGDNSYGQLGLSEPCRKTESMILVKDIKAKNICCGAYHSILIDLENNVLCAGNNSYGQLGLGDRISRKTFTKINIKAISCHSGSCFSLLLDEQGTVFIAGGFHLGQIGANRNIYHKNFKRCKDIKAKFVACGWNHVLVIDLQDNVISFGDNKKGQLGLHDLDSTGPHFIKKIKAKTVACGHGHSIIIDEHYNVWGMGSNKYGQLGLEENIVYDEPTLLKNVKAISAACGIEHSVLITF